MSETYQVLVHFNWFFKDGPNHGFVAGRRGEGAAVAEKWVTVHVAKQVIDRNLICDFNFWLCFGAKDATDERINAHSVFFLFSLRKKVRPRSPMSLISDR